MTATPSPEDLTHLVHGDHPPRGQVLKARCLTVASKAAVYAAATVMTAAVLAALVALPALIAGTAVLVWQHVLGRGS